MNRKILTAVAVTGAVCLILITGACGATPNAASATVPAAVDLVPVTIFPRVGGGGNQQYYSGTEPEYGITEMPDGTTAYFIRGGKSAWWYDRDDDDAICLWFDGFEGFDGDVSGYSKFSIDVAFEDLRMGTTIFQFGSFMFLDTDTPMPSVDSGRQFDIDHLYWFDKPVAASAMEFVTVEGIGGHVLNPFTSGKKLDRIMFFVVYRADERNSNNTIYFRNLRLF